MLNTCTSIVAVMSPVYRVELTIVETLDKNFTRTRSVKSLWYDTVKLHDKAVIECTL